MKAIALSALALGALTASAAVAAEATPAEVAAATAAGPVELTDAQLDQIAGGRIKLPFEHRTGFRFYDSITGQVVVVEPGLTGELVVVPPR
jgi:hypothetical protein